MPLWVWNDEMPCPRMQKLAPVQAAGHGRGLRPPAPRPHHRIPRRRLVPPLGRRLDEGKRLGILVNIYDENSYPSGFAGGHVPARAPDTAVAVRRSPSRLHPVGGGDLLAFFAMLRQQCAPDHRGERPPARRIRHRIPPAPRQRQSLDRRIPLRRSHQPAPRPQSSSPPPSSPTSSDFCAEFGKTIH